MSGKRQPKGSGDKDQPRTNHRHKRKKSHTDPPEKWCGQAHQSKRDTAEGTLNGRDDEAGGHAGKNQIARLADHFFAMLLFEREQTAHHPHDRISISKNVEERENINKQTHKYDK